MIHGVSIVDLRVHTFNSLMNTFNVPALIVTLVLNGQCYLLLYSLHEEYLYRSCSFLVIIHCLAFMLFVDSFVPLLCLSC